MQDSAEGWTSPCRHQCLAGGWGQTRRGPGFDLTFWGVCPLSKVTWEQTHSLHEIQVRSGPCLHRWGQFPQEATWRHPGRKPNPQPNKNLPNASDLL